MKTPVRNLVFKGGGVKAAAYVGVMKAIDVNYKLLEEVAIYAGASSGAIFSCICAMSKDFSDIKRMMDDLDYEKIQQKSTLNLPEVLRPFKSILDEHFGDIECLYRLVHKFGWYSTEYFYDWIKTHIEAQYEAKTGQRPKRAIDFSEFNRVFDKNLVILGANISEHKVYPFSVNHTPQMEVAEAVRISMSIPIYFEPQKLHYPGQAQEDYFGDGGVLYNYPLHLFDQDRDENMETVGCLLVLDPSENPRKIINNSIEYFSSVWDTILSVQDIGYNYLDDEDTSRTCFIKDLGISTYKFTLSREEKDALEAEGERAMNEYLKKRGF